MSRKTETRIKRVYGKTYQEVFDIEEEVEVPKKGMGCFTKLFLAWLGVALIIAFGEFMPGIYNTLMTIIKVIIVTAILFSIGFLIKIFYLDKK